MQLNNFDAALLAGFTGSVSFKDLRSGRMAEIPGDSCGVYAVVRQSDEQPEFLERGTCGDHYGAPFPVEDLRARWVTETRILYLGKAGGPGIKEMLRDRIQKYSSFGVGKNVPHGGGRAIWQLLGSESLLVCWKETPGEVPLGVETGLRERFGRHYGKLPFANRQK
jgi:hypothetical protein